jgi:cardiolipin synthase
VKPRFVDGNAVKLLTNGAEYFPALLGAIDAAQREIHLETYIFATDDLAASIVAALLRARQRDVVVRVMVDGFGTQNFRLHFGRALADAGCEVLVYRADVAMLPYHRQRLRRLHRKLAVIDGRIAFVGGINIIDDTTDTPPNLPRFDYAVAIEGPLVAEIHHAVRKVWHMLSWVHMKERPGLDPTSLLPPTPAGSMRAAFLIRDNLRHRRDIENAYLGAIYSAQKEVLLASAYFLPGLRFRRALLHAAQHGVQITVLLQGKGDHPVLRNAERFLYAQMVGAGICIVEYRSGFLHAKVGVIDGHWATVGSSNIDPFSLLLAREANVVVDNRDFAAGLHSSLMNAIESGGKVIHHEDLKKRSLWQRLINRLAYTGVRIAVGISRYGGKDYRE